MELFGLHDKDGKEYKFINRYGSACWDAIPITPEPKFKVGDWVCVVDCKKSGAGTETVGCVGRIYHKYEDKSGYKVDFFDKNGQWSYESCDIRLATKDEIETHLRNIAEEKGFRNGVHFKGLRFGRAGVMRWQTVGNHGEASCFDRYYEEEDILNVEDTKYGVWEIIYKRGQWAEIIPEKKKLPKTKEELVRMFGEYFGMFNITRHPNYDKFLEDYED